MKLKYKANEIKLECCPFCGAEVDAVEEHTVKGVIFYRVRCKNNMFCPICPQTIFSKNKDDVIKAWNFRDGKVKTNENKNID